jgi:hypothetical protein
MTKYITFDRIIMGIIIIILSISLFTCNKELENSNLALALSFQKIDSIANKNGELIAVNQSIIVSSQEEIRKYTDSIYALDRKHERNIKNILSFYKGITNTIIKERLVPFIDSNAITIWTDSVKRQCESVISFYESKTIRVPRIARDSTANYTAEMTATKQGIIINSLMIPDSQYVRFVTLKGGFMKKNQQGKRELFLKKSIQVQVMHSNPLIHTTGQSSVIYKPPDKKKWLEKAILIGAGVYIGTKL